LGDELVAASMLANARILALALNCTGWPLRLWAGGAKYGALAKCINGKPVGGSSSVLV